jgi:hypothetical protein
MALFYWELPILSTYEYVPKFNRICFALNLDINAEVEYILNNNDNHYQL